MEWIFNFPRLYAIKLRAARCLSQVLKPFVFRNHFTHAAIFERIPPDASLLEIGCGDGGIFKEFLAQGGTGSYAGCDVNRHMIDHCQATYPDQAWYCLQETPYPFDEGSFDYCMFVNVLHHIPSYEEICKTLTEAARVGRRVVLFEPLQSDNGFLRVLKSFYWRITDGGSAYLRLEEFHRLIADTNLICNWELHTRPLRHFYAAELQRPLESGSVGNS